MNRKIWFEQIKKDYPDVPKFIVEWLLDIYENNPDFYSKRTGKKGRPRRNKVLYEIDKIVKERPQSYDLKCVDVVYAQDNKQKESVPLVVDDGGSIVPDKFTLKWD